MAFVSDSRHRARYAVSPAADKQIADIKILLEAIRILPICTPMKRRMLVHAIWEVAFATGNTQRAFMGRYRSEAVVNQPGMKIQRDHIYKKEALVQELLGPSPNLDEILDHAHCCVVTEEEHKRLGHVDDAIDGWERYRAAGITVYDMVDETSIV
ncbi:hypothetical protein [Paludibaculum fermentans]|uniref:Uncharacterized protein n=1 Tax=Paludibaculum fermentans TaxID=1473598 RepID=A0A7S7SN11_PALFE|nr:hypothetical protein [Paludibaculum fermentans]QOY90066.1 hypothetical protein IRI77_08960 [Paludibaculum fermentans]